MQYAWTEFKTVMLPWLIAAACVIFMQQQYDKQNEVLLERINNLETQVSNTNTILATSGYIVPPTQEPRSLLGD